MRKLFPILTSIIISITASAQEPVVVSSKVKSATVYLNQAELKNVGATTLKQGTNYLLFTNLSPFLDANSIRVAADKDLTITGVNVRTNFLDEADMPENFKLTYKKLKDAEFNLALRKSYKKVYEEERSLVTSNKNVLGGDSKLSIEDFTELADIYRNRLKEIEVKILEINQEETKLTQEVEKLKAQLGDRQNNMNQNRSEIEVTVVAKTAGFANFDINYLVYNAGWAPSYEIRTDDNNSLVKLIYKANVFQSTAIDWSEVKLSLSTGNPSVNGTQPQLGPDYVDFMPELREVTIRGGRFSKSNSADEVAAPMQAQGIADFTQVVLGNVNVYFDIALPYSIPSTNRPMGVEIQQFELPVEYQDLSVPKLDRDAFLLANIKGWEKLNLLAGTANVYYKNAYIGQSYIDPSRDKDKLEVSLGRDNGVMIDRKDLNEVSKEGGLLSGNKKSYHYKFTVKNTKQRAVNIRVEDQMPLSRNNDILVENENLTGGLLNTETGIITWNLVLQAGESREFELKYHIKFPKGQRINR